MLQHNVGMLAKS